MAKCEKHPRFELEWDELVSCEMCNAEASEQADRRELALALLPEVEDLLERVARQFDEANGWDTGDWHVLQPLLVEYAASATALLSKLKELR